MEEAQYWMWMKRKQNMLKSHFQTRTNSSTTTWEEKAFAEDAAGGSLGGCIWPPRSYSCSFCMREFRSAQALGGHMNVHRRDRARLKQCLISPDTTSVDVSHHHRHDRNHTHNHHHDDHVSGRHLLVASSRFLSVNSRVSTSKNFSHGSVLLSSPFSSSSHATPCSGLKPELKNKCSKEEEDGIWVVDDDDGDGDGDGYVETDLCVGLNNSVVGRNRPAARFCATDDQEGNYKRTKMAISPIVPFLQLQPCPLQSSEVIGITSLDDVDLELRLGDPPN